MAFRCLLAPTVPVCLPMPMTRNGNGTGISSVLKKRHGPWPPKPAAFDLKSVDLQGDGGRSSSKQSGRFFVSSLYIFWLLWLGVGVGGEGVRCLPAQRHRTPSRNPLAETSSKGTKAGRAYPKRGDQYLEHRRGPRRFYFAQSVYVGFPGTHVGRWDVGNLARARRLISGGANSWPSDLTNPTRFFKRGPSVPRTRFMITKVCATITTCALEPWARGGRLGLWALTSRIPQRAGRAAPSRGGSGSTGQTRCGGWRKKTIPTVLPGPGSFPRDVEAKPCGSSRRR